jgi:hypothetical protein
MSALCMDSSLLARDFDSYNRRVCIFGLSMETLIPPEFCKGSNAEPGTFPVNCSATEVEADFLAMKSPGADRGHAVGGTAIDSIQTAFSQIN